VIINSADGDEELNIVEGTDKVVDITQNMQGIVYSDASSWYSVQGSTERFKVWDTGTVIKTILNCGSGEQAIHELQENSVMQWQMVFAGNLATDAWILKDKDGDAIITVYNGGTDNTITVQTTGRVDLKMLGLLERSSDPAEPAEGEAVMWLSDGTGKGGDGDIMVASKAGGTTKYGVLFDHSGGTAW
jgi:hypothetical protein